MKILVNENNRIEFELNNVPKHLDLEDLNKVKSIIRVSQIQLLQWIIYKYNMQKNETVNINIQEYFKVKGLSRRKENIDNFLEDIFILSNMTIAATLKFKGEEELVTSKFISFNGCIYKGKDEVTADFIPKKKINDVCIKLGDWIKKIKLNQFVYMDSNFFRFNCKTEAIAIILSIKFAQLLRTNISKLQKDGYYNCRIATVLNYLNISRCTLNKQGTKYYIKILKNSLKLLEKEGYIFKFDVEEKIGVNDFLETRIYYTNPTILEEYKNIKRKNSKQKVS